MQRQLGAGNREVTQRRALVVQALGRLEPMEGTACPAPALPWLHSSAPESVRAET